MGPPLMPLAQRPRIQGSPDPLAGPETKNPEVLEMTAFQRASNENATKPHPAHRVMGEKNALEHSIKQPESTPVTTERQVIRQSVENKDHHIARTLNAAQADLIDHEEEIHATNSRDTSPSYSLQDIERQIEAHIDTERVNSVPLFTWSESQEQLYSNTPAMYVPFDFSAFSTDYLARKEAEILEKGNKIQALNEGLRLSQSSLDAMIARVRVAEEARDAAEEAVRALESQVDDAEAKMDKEKEQYRGLMEEKVVLERKQRERVRKSQEWLDAESAAQKLQHQKWERQITPSPLEAEKESNSSGSSVWSWLWIFK
ncbi:hypothetical protein KCU93_g5690, partial [Aureobasidium melanogenum]